MMKTYQCKILTDSGEVITKIVKAENADDIAKESRLYGIGQLLEAKHETH